jgi:DNA-binding LacI/PurR family transcriptional regulator
MAECLASGCTALGTSSDLARRCAVSVPTVARVLRLLREEGAVAGGRGQRLRVVEEPARRLLESAGHMVPPRAGSAWQRVCGCVEDDIRSGAYRSVRRLPSLKELTVRYGANHRTVQRALADLCSRSLLIREGAGYALPRVAPPRGSGEVVLIARGGEGGHRHEPVILYERTQVMLSRLDEVCQQSGVRLTAACLYYVGTDMEYSPVLRELVRDTERRKNVLGFVVWPVSLVRSVAVELVENRLRPLGLPIAVFDDEDRMLPRSAALHSGGALVFFSLVNQRAAGSAVGRYLADAGCRRVVYLTNGTSDYWVFERLEGLREAFGRRGTDAVEAIVPEVLSRQPPQTDSNVAGDSGSYALRRPVQGREELAYRQMLSKALSSAVDERLQRGGVDAWVGANDTVALVCMDILVSRGVRVGVDAAVVGFDNSFESAAYRLSSYGFNEPALVDGMMHHILDRRWAGRFRDAGPVISVNGMLAERESSSGFAKP